MPAGKMPKSSGYFAEVITLRGWEEKIGRIRFETFVELLKWVNGDPEAKREIDRYDEHAAHIAVLSETKVDEIFGYVRILLADSSSGLMLTKEPCFRNILPKDFATEPRSMEVSRLCLAEKIRKTKAGFVVSELLFRSVLVFMETHEIDLLYAIADTKDARGHSHYDLLMKRFPLFKEIGSGELKPGITTHIMSLTREGLEKALARQR